eukprot:792567-Prorocentrum_minimum.AAC.10
MRFIAVGAVLVRRLYPGCFRVVVLINPCNWPNPDSVPSHTDADRERDRGTAPHLGQVAWHRRWHPKFCQSRMPNRKRKRPGRGPRQNSPGTRLTDVAVVGDPNGSLAVERADQAHRPRRVGSPSDEIPPFDQFDPLTGKPRCSSSQTGRSCSARCQTTPHQMATMPTQSESSSRDRTTSLIIRPKSSPTPATRMSVRARASANSTASASVGE